MAADPLPPPAKPGRCVRCRNQMSWANQRVQYGRCLRAGLSADAARLLMPMCQKCVTRHLTAVRAADPGPPRGPMA